MLPGKCRKRKITLRPLLLHGLNLLLEPQRKELHDFQIIIAADSLRKAGKAEAVILIADQVWRLPVLLVLAQHKGPATNAELMRDFVVAGHVRLEVLCGDQHGAALITLDADVARVLAVPIGHA